MKKIIARILGYIYGSMRSAYYNRRYEEYRKMYQIDENFGFNGTDIRIYGEGKLEVGSSSYLGSNTTIQLHKGNKVIIGSNCSISHNVRLYTSSVLVDQDFCLQTLEEKTGNIEIGNGVWIGANVFINPGIKIGNNVVIGANSVVTKDVQDYAVVGGVPAKEIRKKTILQKG